MFHNLTQILQVIYFNLFYSWIHTSCIMHFQCEFHNFSQNRSNPHRWLLANTHYQNRIQLSKLRHATLHLTQTQQNMSCLSLHMCRHRSIMMIRYTRRCLFCTQLYPDVRSYSLPVGMYPLLNDMHLNSPSLWTRQQLSLSFLLYLCLYRSQLMAARLKASVFGSHGSR